MKRAVYPGSFDPVTNGHLDIIRRSAVLVDELYIAVLVNQQKQPLFTLGERMDMLRLAAADIKNVRVVNFRGLLVDFCESINVNIIVKGLRAMSDFEYEFRMALINRKLNDNIETLFMMTSDKYQYLSSSIVKEIGAHGGRLTDLVPPEIERTLAERLSGAGTRPEG